MLTSESTRNPGGLAIRTLTVADLPFAAALNARVGWNQTESDWRGYLEFEAGGCFLAEMEGRPAGTATTIRYDGEVGWIGMVLVHPEYRRAGIGTTLLRHAIDHLQGRRIGCIKLDATPMGRNVYVPLGFADEYEVTRYEGIAGAGGAGPEPGIERLTAKDLVEIAAADTMAFGVSRPAVLASLIQRNPEWCFLARDARGLNGYVIAREGRQAVQLGPWIASDAGIAQRLLRAVIQGAAGRRVFLDVPNPNAAGRRLVESLGFTVQRGFTRMYLGKNPRPGNPAHVFGTSGAEKG